MSDWKSTEWQEKLKNKPLKYWIRDEIEEIIKEENIDRKQFGEYSKFKYKEERAEIHNGDSLKYCKMVSGRRIILQIARRVKEGKICMLTDLLYRNTERELKTEFLGYDYAYENGDNYSAVYNEIPFVFPEFELNQNGLFQTKEEIIEYISRREEYEKTHKPYTLEVGDFTIFEVYEVIL